MKPSLLLPALLLAACTYSYRMDHPAQTQPQLRITGVKLARGSTTIDFAYAATELRRIGVHPTGHEGAFRITSLDGKRVWKLEKISKIATLPDRTTVDAGETLEFSLTFEAIPESLRLCNVGEGGYDPESGETSWQFVEVRLRADSKDGDLEHGKAPAK